MLLDAAERGIDRIREASASLPGLLLFIGRLSEQGSRSIIAAYAICEGRVVAAVPKTYVPNYNEFYERRWWNPAPVGDGADTSQGCDARCRDMRGFVGACAAEL